jgi:non-ribosomal peptide synthetase component F
MAAADPAEPLIVTKQPQAELLVTSAAVQHGPSINAAMERLSLAMAQSIRAEQQAMQAACKSSPVPKAGSSQAYDWHARCSYDRR